MTAPKHPAPFSPPILKAFKEILEGEVAARGNRKIRVLDNFAGIGRIHELATNKIETVGVELEEEWAEAHPMTVIGNALYLPWRRKRFHVLATSPCYGNRFADHHNAKDGSHRRTYKHYLGRDLSPQSSAAMQWGEEYRIFHAQAWKEANRVLLPGALAVINISNHFRTLKKGEPPMEMKVSEWHLSFFLNELGYSLEEVRKVGTRRYKFGKNRDSRAANELVLVMRKPL